MSNKKKIYITFYMKHYNLAKRIISFASFFNAFSNTESSFFDVPGKAWIVILSN